jgi:hypothetical protein
MVFGIWIPDMAHMKIHAAQGATACSLMISSIHFQGQDSFVQPFSQSAVQIIALLLCCVNKLLYRPQMANAFILG